MWFAEEKKTNGRNGALRTVINLYKSQLADLMFMLKSTTPHFIRCIIPNDKKQVWILIIF